MRKDKIPRDTMGKEEKRVEPRINLDGEEEDVARIEKGALESRSRSMEGILSQGCRPTINYFVEIKKKHTLW